MDDREQPTDARPQEPRIRSTPHHPQIQPQEILRLLKRYIARQVFGDIRRALTPPPKTSMTNS
jgi:hypothetical protein